MPDEIKEEKVSIAQLARRLRMTSARIRAYYRAGIFPQPIREPGEKGGYWLPWAVKWMEERRNRTHEFRMPKPLREMVEAEMEKQKHPRTKRPKRDSKTQET